MNDGTGMFFAASICIAAAFLYFIPSIVASSRKVANGYTGIALLNLFLGWTVLGWIGALIWACTAETKAQAQLREMAFAQLAHGGYPPQYAPAVPVMPQPSGALEAGRNAGEIVRMASPAKVLTGVFAIIVALCLGFAVLAHFIGTGDKPVTTHPVSLAQ